MVIMRKLSVPVSVQRITRENIDAHIESFKDCKVSRVFLVGFEAVKVKDNYASTHEEEVRFIVNELKKAGLEVGFWFSSLGHGAALLHDENAAASSLLLSKNSIPTCFEGSDLPLYIMGENAKYVDLDQLSRGAILDIKAAEILKKRGVDTGFISEEALSADGEYFIKDDDTIRNLWNVALRKIECDDKAEVLSRFTPSDSPATYKYENNEGQRFFVLAFDHYASGGNPNYFNSYYRQSQLIEAVGWMGKKLPAVCAGNPNLYVLAAKNDEAMSVMLANVFLDDVLEPEITLDIEYSEIRFVNCSGELKGDKVFLSDIAPYGFAAFEVK